MKNTLKNVISNWSAKIFLQNEEGKEQRSEFNLMINRLFEMGASWDEVEKVWSELSLPKTFLYD